MGGTVPEPDDRMGSFWPDDWSTGWVTGKWVDAAGIPLTGKVTLELSVKRAASPATGFTIIGGVVTISVVNGVPSGPNVTENEDNIPCVEFPVTDDPDIQPQDLQLIITESWGGKTRRTLSATDTLDSPLWLTGDLTSLTPVTGFVFGPVWWVSEPYPATPPGARVGDTLIYVDQIDPAHDREIVVLKPIGG